MNSQSRIARAIGGAVAVALVTALLTGCGPVNPGSAEENAFTNLFSSDPAVAETDVTGHSSFPWTGALSGTVIARQGLDDDEAAALAHRIGEYIVAPDSGATIPSLGLLIDGVRFEVTHDRDWNERLLGFVLELRTDPDLLTAELYAGAPKERSRLTLTAIRPGAIPGLWARWGEPFGGLGDGVDDVLTVQDAHETFRAQGPPGDWSERVFAAWAAVEDRFAVTRLSAEPDAVELAVAQESDVDEVSRIAFDALGAGAPPLAVTAELLDLAAYSNGEAARAVLSRLSPAALEHLRRAWSDDHTSGGTALRLWVDDADSVAIVARELAALPQADFFASVGVEFASTEAEAEAGGFGVEAPPAELEGRMEQLEQLRSETGAERLRLQTAPAGADTDPLIDIRLAELPPDEQLASLGAALQPLMPDGGRVAIDLGAEIRLSLFATPLIDPEQAGARQWARYSAPFAEAWNAAAEG